MKKMYSLNEIGLLPSSNPSPVDSRKNISTYYFQIRTTKKSLPIFVAPMPCIVNKDNFSTFDKYKIFPILPRGIKDNSYVLDLLLKGRWIATSLKEFEDFFLCPGQEKHIKSLIKRYSISPMHVCIDMANGHMEKLYNIVKIAKEKYKGDLIIMVGNIANPHMYIEYAKIGVDYVRVGIGGGNACSTSVLTGIHASLPWLLEEIKKLKLANPEIKGFPYIVADGGIDTIDKAIKCLALGADFVMMGKMFAQCEEACGETKCEITYNYDDNSSNYYVSSHLLRKYYGNASTDGQIALNGRAIKPSEGVSTYVRVNTTLDKLLTKFDNALRSAMSYTGAKNLESFIGKVDWRPMSTEEFKSYYKKDES